MTKWSRLKDLVLEVLKLALLLSELINQLLDLVNKVVNYARQIRKLQIFLFKKWQAYLCSFRFGQKNWSGIEEEDRALNSV